MKPTRNNVLTVSVLSLMLLGCGGDSSGDRSGSTVINGVTYKLTFKSDWNATNFPTNYPSGSAHFSPLIGMTHNASASLFSTGKLATSGVEIVAEAGSTNSIKSEIGNIQNLGFSQSLIEGGDLPNGQIQVEVTFSLDEDFSLVSVITMVAPSPDWFVGVDSLNLFQNGQWVDELVVELKTYDAGTDDGVSFTSGNADTSPKENITLLTSAASDTDFSNGVHRSSGQHIGTFTFKRQ
ncbi:spondin domain-containing protein [Vibrio harveyi]|uniref:spondin domain-containing protein n=1 Tax=Vibrio harveyi TaxID=669 RepID=UPI001EFD31C7|nr:spondin domain-containing protein [Vibrio harveyi]MCG9550586.1 spondin domain-containing protein [Vibrio harveyi]